MEEVLYSYINASKKDVLKDVESSKRELSDLLTDVLSNKAVAHLNDITAEEPYNETYNKARDVFKKTAQIEHLYEILSDAGEISEGGYVEKKEIEDLKGIQLFLAEYQIGYVRNEVLGNLNNMESLMGNLDRGSDDGNFNAVFNALDNYANQIQELNNLNSLLMANYNDTNYIGSEVSHRLTDISSKIRAYRKEFMDSREMI